MTLGNPDNMRLPPASLEAEQALLGALLANNKAMDRVAFLDAGHFQDPIHAKIFEAIRRRTDRGELADGVTLHREFLNSGALAEVGGPGYLADLLGSMVGIVNAGEYGRMIFDCYLRRKIIQVAELARERAYGAADEEGDTSLQAGDILQALDVDLAELTRAGAGGAEARSTATVVAEVMENFTAAAQRKGRLAGISTGYKGLDRMLGGFQPSQLILVAGRPAMGKTALALGMILRAAAEGARVYFASAEMEARQVLGRGMAAIAEIPVTAALRAAEEREDGSDLGGEMHYLDPNGPEAHRLANAGRRLSGLAVHWDDSPVQTVAGIRSKARLIQRRSGLDLVVVDYIGRLKPSTLARGYKNRTLEIGEIARDLKELGRELGVPVVALSQLSREVEKREDKRPNLSDLRDSGELEQEADVVLFPYREEYYLRKNPPVRGERETEEKFHERLAGHGTRLHDAKGRAEVIVAKQRQGREGPVRLRFDAPRIWFSNEGEKEPAVPGLPD